jgi:branched-chain amino acid transport system permease protein
LSQPQFLLGAIFVIFVLFVPGGLAGALLRLRMARARRKMAAAK